MTQEVAAIVPEVEMTDWRGNGRDVEESDDDYVDVDDEMLSQVEEGFLVSDGHLSSEEYNFSAQSQSNNQDSDRRAEILLRRQKYKENFTR